MISANINRVREHVARACDRAGRRPDEVTLIAVTKTFPVEALREAMRAGVTDFGENYAQELVKKHDEVGDQVRWHFIGHLQTNKVRSIAPWVHLVHGVDSSDVARELDRRAAQAGRVLDVLVEVNTTGEESKFGLAPDRVESFIRGLEGLNHLRIAGLMTIGPFLPDPEGSRPMFRILRNLRDRLGNLPQGNAEVRLLSMGMTGDFEVAIEEGATHIRVGTAIFGPRVHRT
jgi:hypothetical protein